MKFGYSMPSSAPLYPEPPFLYENNRVISILFKTSPGVLKDLVPVPLTPNPDNLAFIYAGVFNVPHQAVYKEVGFGVPAAFKEVFGNFMVYLYLDPALAIMPGREIWGWPKKDALIDFSEENGVFSVNVTRGGATIMRASVNASEKIEPIPDQPDAPNFNLKLIPSVKKDHPPDVLQLTITAGSTRKKELYRGNATLIFNSSAEDPLANIPVLQIMSGEQSIEDMILGYGDVLYDYLNPAG
jgi:acetoacetate decarboxylase